MWKILRLALPVMVVLSLTGCGHDKTPQTDDSHNEISTPTTSAPPLPPALLTENSEAGATATAEYWMELSFAALMTGETKNTQEISDSACTTCTETAQVIRNIYSSGAHLTGQHFVIQDKNVQVFTPGKQAVVLMHIHSLRIIRVETDGHISVYSEDSIKPYQFNLRWDKSRWKVHEVADAS